MYFNWDRDTIRWYTNSEKYTGFFKKLAEAIAPMVADCKTLCDLGCGLALFDFEIAPRFDAVDCLDINKAALSAVSERAQERGIDNIHTLLQDCDALSGAWDAVYMSFFGSRELDRYLPFCKKLVAVVAAASNTELFPKRGRGFTRNTDGDTREYLDTKGIPYALTTMRLEFGQPFTSIEDAAHFQRTYAPYASDGEIDTFLAQKLVKTESAEFPYYIPREKSVGIFELKGGLV
ncbi:hypothetical protein SAMN02745823_03234 [Sporobacter termitidis DSM 10068]|uniref:Methyltransferase domain-containing protein n=1 Tax=Sporobacter termitidis DSM 10068 TaxID=1123282 RepID=A0A1M5Z4W6_9FIRM|nr:class I SAM-dependent methyltransferase [Sporobacter termitidis]SHI19250.1 hypothetical protein SAMN02745823_03234 [Sporobacter termitidis DSM 10068]